MKHAQTYITIDTIQTPQPEQWNAIVAILVYSSGSSRGKKKTKEEINNNKQK